MLRTGFLVGLVLLVFALGGASGVTPEAETHTVTIDFEEFEKGERVFAVAHPGSDRMIRVVGVNPRFSQNAAVIFDSADPGAVDIDLGTPHRDFEVVRDDARAVPGPGEGEGGRQGEPCQNDHPLGKLLVVDDDLAPTGDDGRVVVPDDEGRAGGRLLIDFSEVGPVTIHDMAVIDVEEPDAVVWLYDVGIEERKNHPKRKQVLARFRVHTEDNGVARLFDPELRAISEESCHVTLERRQHGRPLNPVEGVLCIETAFNGSGAVAGIIYSVPGEDGRAEGP